MRMFYKHITTAEGILEKEDNTNDEFIVPTRLHEKLSKKELRTLCRQERRI